MLPVHETEVISVIALARRRVNVIWTMLRDGRPYEEPEHVVA